MTALHHTDRLGTISSNNRNNYPRDGVEPHDLMTAADTAMYAAKTTGKNRFTAHHRTMPEALDHRVALG
jgi:GGDEF domain-containing protein